MEDIVIIEPKDYSHVVFEDIQESYPQNVDMECLFTINELLKIDEADFVGIYKVGFKNTREFVTSIPMNSTQVDETRKIKLTIFGDKLPKDDEFYQLVYVSQNTVRGASIPFQFKRNGSVEEQQEEEKVNTNEAEIEIINSKIRIINSEFKKFENVCDIYENCIEETESVIEMVLFSHAHSVDLKLSKKFSESLEEIVCPDSDSEQMNDEEKKIRRKTEGLVYSVHCAAKKVKELQADLELIKKKKEDMEIVTDDVTSVLRFDNSLNDEIEQVSVYLEDRTEEMRKLIKEIEENTLVMLQIKHEVKENEMLMMDIFVNLPKKYAANPLSQEKPLVNSSRNSLINKYVVIGKKLLETQERKEFYKKRTEILSNELEVLKSKFDADKLETSINEKRLIDENKGLVMEISQLKRDYDNRIEEINGSYYALSIANVHLDSRIKSIEDKYKKQIDAQKNTIEVLRKENERLQEIMDNKCLALEKLGEKCYQEKRKSIIESKKQQQSEQQQYSLDKDYFQMLKNSDSQLDKFIRSSIDYNVVKNNSLKNKVSQLLNEYVSDSEDGKWIDSEPLMKSSIDENFKRENTIYESVPQYSKQSMTRSIYDNAGDLNNNQKQDNCCNTGCMCYKTQANCTCGNKCPLCLWKFPYEYTQQEIDNHFESHFAN